jgi:hypothetical protein
LSFCHTNDELNSKPPQLKISNTLKNSNELKIYLGEPYH